MGRNLKQRRVVANVSIPGDKLGTIDRVAAREGQTRSAFIAEAAIEKADRIYTERGLGKARQTAKVG